MEHLLETAKDLRLGGSASIRTLNALNQSVFMTQMQIWLSQRCFGKREISALRRANLVDKHLKKAFTCNCRRKVVWQNPTHTTLFRFPSVNEDHAHFYLHSTITSHKIPLKYSDIYGCNMRKCQVQRGKVFLQGSVVGQN